VEPARVREARLAAGLSLAGLARDDVSRTFIHLVETGRARPSKAVLNLIAERTQKPVSFFLRPARLRPTAGDALADELSRVAGQVHGFVRGSNLTKKQVAALKMVEKSLRRGAMLARSIESVST
jgi:hypothetical protein